MKIAIIGLLIIGSAFAAPERLRRDAPILPEWQVPDAGFEGRAYEGGYNVGFGSFRDDELIHEEYGPPPIPHEDYGPPAVPHEDYGPPRLLPVPETTPHYCPEEDIIPPFAPAPPAPGAYPLPEVPVFRQEPVFVPHQDYGPPQVPHEDYGPPIVVPDIVPPFVPAPPAPEVLPLPEVPIIPEIPHEDYGPPQLKYEPIPPPPPVFYAPYPAPIPITTVPPPPPPIPVFYAPYPAPVTTTEVPTTTTTPAPTTTVYYAPYPPPVVYTSPPAPITTTAPVTLRSAPYPYPSKTVSHYDSDSGLSSSAVSEGSFQNYVPIPAVRAPTHIVSSIKYVKPRIVISKKVIGFPKLFLKKRSIFKFFH